MILSKMSHPPKQMKVLCRRSQRRKDKRETNLLLIDDFTLTEKEEDTSKLDDEDWVRQFLRHEEECRQEIEDDIAARDLATDDYRFRHRLGEYEGWDDDDNALGDYF
jgi:hypothetical protein